MGSVQSMLSRVRRLEAARAAPVSPFARIYGSMDAFEAKANAGINAGQLDPSDMPVVIQCLRRWDREGIWGAWQRQRVWELGR